ncbi:hypothetical protein H8959_007922 [Pygathrix nigripes]
MQARIPRGWSVIPPLSSLSHPSKSHHRLATAYKLTVFKHFHSLPPVIPFAHLPSLGFQPGKTRRKLLRQCAPTSSTLYAILEVRTVAVMTIPNSQALLCGPQQGLAGARGRPLGARGWKAAGRPGRTACPSGRVARCAAVERSPPKPGAGLLGPPRGSLALGEGPGGGEGPERAGRRADAPGGGGGGLGEETGEGPRRRPARWLQRFARSRARRGRRGVGGGPAPGPGCGLGAAGTPGAYRGRRKGPVRGVGGAAAGWGRGRRRRGRGRWRSRGGRSSVFVFVARWLPASHHVTRTRGRGAAPSSAAAAAAASLRGSGPRRLSSCAPRVPRAPLSGRQSPPTAPTFPPRHVTRAPGWSRDVGPQLRAGSAPERPLLPHLLRPCDARPLEPRPRPPWRSSFLQEARLDDRRQ